MQVTLDDVAKAAGVSKATVSRVINGKTCVRPHVRERVLKAIKKLDYHPNGVARALATRRTRNIALVLSLPSEMPGLGLGLVQGMEAVLRRDQLNLVLVLLDPTTARWDAPAVIQQRQVDGVIAGGSLSEAGWLQEVQEQRIPLVTLGDDLPALSVSGVHLDYLTAATLAVRHLAKQGYQRIALVSPPEGRRSSDESVLGFVRAMEAVGLAAEPSAIVRADRNLEASDRGEQAVRQLLTREQGRPQAIYIADENMVAGAVRAIKSLGLRVPEDVALIGWGSGSKGEEAIGLTAVTVSREQIGRMAAMLLMDLLQDPDRPATQLAITPTLVVRESCGVRPLPGREATQSLTVATA